MNTLKLDKILNWIIFSWIILVLLFSPFQSNPYKFFIQWNFFPLCAFAIIKSIGFAELKGVFSNNIDTLKKVFFKIYVEIRIYLDEQRLPIIITLLSVFIVKLILLLDSKNHSVADQKNKVISQSWNPLDPTTDLSMAIIVISVLIVLVLRLLLIPMLKEKGEELFCSFKEYIKATSGVDDTTDIKNPPIVWRVRIEVVEEKYRNAFSFEISDSDIEKITDLNMKIAKNTPFSTSREIKYNRNFSHFKTHDKSFLVILSDDKIIGYTHIVAANQYNWNRFKDGTISDAGLGCSYIISQEREFQDDQPYGLIVVTIALQYARKEKSQRKEYEMKMSTLLKRAMSIHLQKYMDEEFKHQRIIPIAYQTVSPKLLKTFKGFTVYSNSYCKETRAQIVCLEVDNYQPVSIIQ